jgi:hypothetical protein
MEPNISALDYYPLNKVHNIPFEHVDFYSEEYKKLDSLFHFVIMDEMYDRGIGCYENEVTIQVDGRRKRAYTSNGEKYLNLKDCKYNDNFSIVSLSIRDINYDTYHSNILLYDWKRKRIYYFEPYGKFEFYIYSHIKRKVLNRNPGYEFRAAINEECGPQAIGEDDDVCSSYSMMYILMAIGNVDLDPDILMERFIKLDNFNVKVYTYKFIIWVATQLVTDEMVETYMQFQDITESNKIKHGIKKGATALFNSGRIHRFNAYVKINKLLEKL